MDLAGDPEPALAGALTPRTRLVWFETPSNPLLKVVDIAAVVRAVAGHELPGAHVHLAHGRVDGVDGDPADGEGLVEVLLGGDVAAAGVVDDEARRVLAAHRLVAVAPGERGERIAKARDGFLVDFVRHKWFERSQRIARTASTIE